MKLEHTITVSGTVQQNFGGEPWGDPETPYGYGTYLSIEHYYGKVKISMTSGKGWEHIRLSEEQIKDLIVTLEDAITTIPLVADWCCC